MPTPKTSTFGSSASSQRSSGRIEVAVTSLISIWIVVLPWLMGGRFWWTQALGAVIGAFALGLALSTRENRRVLRRFPVFWLGLLFLSYVACQALNPWAVAVQRRADVLVWDLFLLPHIRWLPAGVSGDYFAVNTWRMFVYWLAPWLLVCAWWAAVKRRRSGRRLLLVVFINGLLTAAIILVQKQHPPAKFLWVYVDPAIPGQLFDTTSAGFVNRNMAAMYLYLSLGAGMAIAGRLMARARSEGKDTGLAWIVLFGCLALVGVFFILGSRAGLVIACGYFLIGVAFLLVASIGRGGRLPGLWAGVAVLLLGLASLTAYEIIGGHSWTLQREEYLRTLTRDDTRAVLRQETFRMIPSHLWLGWGAGSYRYVSPDYFREDNYFTDSKSYGGLSLFTDYAHCDWLQLPMEFGIAGASLMLAILIYWIGYALWLGRRLGAEGWVVLLAVAALLAHAALDFPLYNTAVLALFCLLGVSTLKTASLASRSRSSRTHS